MNFASVFACHLLVLISYAVVVLFQSSAGAGSGVSADVKGIETVQFLIQNQIIGFVGGSVSVIIAIATYLMTRRAADERRDEAINLRIKEFSRNEVEKLRLEMMSKMSELQVTTQQFNTTLATVMQNVVKLESEIGQLKVELARLSALLKER